jgi:hypothetical protein
MQRQPLIPTRAHGSRSSSNRGKKSWAGIAFDVLLGWPNWTVLSRETPHLMIPMPCHQSNEMGN